MDNPVLGRYYAPQSQHYPLSTGMPSPETALQTGTTHTGMKSNYGAASSIIYRSKPLVFTGGSSSYNHNIPDNRQSPVNGVKSDVKPAESDVFSGLPQQSFERPQSAANGRLLHPKVAQSGNSYHSHPVIIRKSSDKGAARPFQLHSPPQIWGPRDAQKPYTFEKTPRSDPLKVPGDQTLWQPSHKPPFSSQISRSRSASPASRGHNVNAAPRSQSSTGGIQSSSIPSFAIPNAPDAPSISSTGTYAVKGNQRPEKLTSSVTDFSRGLDSVRRRSETPGLRKGESYLFKNVSIGTMKANRYAAFHTSPHTPRPSVAPVHSFREDVRHNPKNTSPLYNNGAQTGNFPKYQRPTEAVPPGTDVKRLVPAPHADLPGSYATGGQKPAVRDPFRTTTRGSEHAHKPGKTVKSMYGFRGFNSPVRKAEKEPDVLPSRGSNDNSPRYSTDKGKFTFANKRPSLPPSSIFGQRPTPSTPVKPQRKASTASPGTTKTRITPRPLSLGLKEPRPLDSKPDPRHYRIHRRIYSLKGFDPRPLEGAKAAIGEPNKSVHQGVESSKLRRSQTDDKTQPDSKHITTVKPDEKHNADLKSVSQTPAGNEALSRFTPNRASRHNNYTHLGVHPIQKRIANATGKAYWGYKAGVFPSVYFRSAVESGAKHTSSKPQPVAVMLNSSTSSMVRGQRVVDKTSFLTNYTRIVNIVRLPKRPRGLRPIKYADILGSASFSSVRVTNQTTILKDDLEENKPGVQGEDIKMSGLFLDSGGSGSGDEGLHSSDLSPDMVKSWGIQEDSLERDYLRISTQNISFKSMKLV